MESEANGVTAAFSRKLDTLCSELVRALRAIEQLQRRFFPPAIASLQEEILPLLPTLEQARRDIRKIEPSRGFEGIRDTVDRSAGLMAEALELVTGSSRIDMENAVIRVLQGLRKCCRAQEQLFRLRRELPRINRFFLEPEARDRASQLDPEPPLREAVGLHHKGTERDPYARGAYSLYVPESYDGAKPWPLVTALHGGFGHGRDFLWNWLREARSRRFLLLAPTSAGSTWSLLMPEVDGAAIDAMLREVTAAWNVDPDRMLLTGISDGGTFALATCMRGDSPFTAYAVIACVLPPGPLETARGRRIYWIHGALDWMFRLQIAQRDARVLEQAGADVTLRVVHDLSHTYPREENRGILDWFDPCLRLSGSTT
jgi:phospholipase/carboxylesterase